MAARAERLGSVLGELGLAGAALAHYLASRVDLFPALARAAFHAVPIPAPLSPAAMEAIVRRELREDSHGVFRRFDPHPLGASPYFQWHRAELLDGAEAVIKFVRPEAETLRAEEGEGLRRLVARLPAESWPGLREGLDDFLALAERRLDLRGEGDDRFHRSSGALERVRQASASRRACWYHAPAGRPLVDVLEEAAGESGDGARVQLAHRLCLSWLEEALHGRRYPEEMDAEDVWALDDGSVAVAAGAFAELTPAAQVALQAHLSAAARHEPDAAALALLAVIPDPDGGAADLRLRYRQAEPFHEDLGLGPFRGARLADILFVMWRAAREAGSQLPAEALAFFRGVSGLERLTRRLAPGYDALGEALDDVRVLDAVRDLSDLLAPSRLPATLARSMPPALDLMRRAERAALLGRDVIAEDDVLAEDEAGARSGPTTFAAGLVLFVVSSLLGARALPALLGAELGARVAALVVIAAGGIALAAAVREVR